MPLTIGSVVYRHVVQALVVDSAGNPLENLTGGQVFATVGGPALAIAEYPSGAALTSVGSSVHGFTPDLYVAFPADAAPEGFIDWPDDGVPASPIAASGAEFADWMRSFVVADSAALVDANTQLELRVLAAEQRVDEAIASIPADGGTSTGGRDVGLFEVGYVNGVCEYPTLADAQAAGMKDSDVAIHGPLPRNTPPVAWIRQNDRVDLLP